MQDTIKKTKVAIQVAILVIIVLSCFFRFYGIREQGFFFHDSVLMDKRAAILKTFFFSQNEILKNSSDYVDSKILWLLLIALGQILTNNAYWAAHLVSALLGLLTVYLVYQTTRDYYRSERLGILSAFFLGTSLLHIFYSRVGIAESASCYLSLLSVYFYIKFLKKKGHYLVLAGIIGGLAFLCNRYRVFLLPLFIMLLHFGYPFQKNRKISGIFKNGLSYTLLYILPFLIYEGIVHLAGLFGIYVPSFWHGLKVSLGYHGLPEFQLYDLLTYPYFLYKFGGPLLITLGAISIFRIKSKKSPMAPLLCVLAQIIACMFVDERGVRNISVILPFFAITCAISTEFLFQFIKKRLHKNHWAHLLIVLFFLSQLIFASQIFSFRSRMEEAMKWLNDHSMQAKIISVSPSALAYHPLGKILMTPCQWDYTFKNFKKFGGDYLIVDLQAYIYGFDDRDRFHDPRFLKFLKTIDTKCPPIKSLKSYALYLQEWLAFEHTRHLSVSQNWLNELNAKTGTIKIYNLNRCIQTEEGHLN